MIVADLARQFEVSPSPVREALLRLASDGLVQNANHRRATVIRFSKQDIIDVFQVREILESGAARLAADRITPAQLDELRLAAKDCAALYGDVARKKEMLDLDNRFHLLVAEASGNDCLRADIVRYSHRIRVIQWLRLPPATMEVGFKEHMAVWKALKAGSGEKAQSAMAAHIGRALELVLEGLSQHEA